MKRVRLPLNVGPGCNRLQLEKKTADGKRTDNVRVGVSGVFPAGSL